MPPPAAKPRPSPLVYFLLDEWRGALKIGKSVNVEERQRRLETGHPDDLRLLAAVSGDERAFHRRFAEYRVRREWFRYEGALRAFVESIKDCRP